MTLLAGIDVLCWLGLGWAGLGQHSDLLSVMLTSWATTSRVIKVLVVMSSLSRLVIVNY